MGKVYNAPSAMMAASRPRMQPIDILLVEDDPDDVSIIRESLSCDASNPACQLHVVGDGKSALDFLRRSGSHTNSPRPDLVLLDLGLPGTSGWIVLEEMARNITLRAIPVVVMSGVVSYQCVLQSYRLRANCYICKPDTPQGLQAAVNSIMRFWLGTVRLPQKDITA